LRKEEIMSGSFNRISCGGGPPRGITFKGAVIQLAACMIFAGFCLLCADADTMEDFLMSKVIGGMLCLVGMVVIAHLDKGGSNDIHS
jgi:hypothetical protein